MSLQTTLERKYNQLLDEERDRRDTAESHVVSMPPTEDSEPAKLEATLEIWCTKLVMGFLVLSVLGWLFMRRVVPHTNICVQDSFAPGILSAH